jgi:serine/threonine-protein kinase RsbW
MATVELYPSSGISLVCPLSALEYGSQGKGMVRSMTVKITAGGSQEMDFEDGFESVAAESFRVGPTLHMGLTIRSEIEAISPLVDRLMPMIKLSHCVPGDERDVEIALREALANAVLHGNKQDIQRKVHFSCRIHPGRELSIVIKDEGSGFDPSGVPDPTSVENVLSENGRGIYLMKMLMDEVRFEHGGTEVRLQKGFKRKAGWSFQK